MLNERLNQREEAVMNAVVTLATGREKLLCTPQEILALLPPKQGMDEGTLDGVLSALELDGYFQLTHTERKGEKMYVFHLLTAGLSYKRSGAQRKRSFYIRLLVTVALAVLSFLIGIVLKLIFT